MYLFKLPENWPNVIVRPTHCTADPAVNKRQHHGSFNLCDVDKRGRDNLPSIGFNIRHVASPYRLETGMSFGHTHRICDAAFRHGPTGQHSRVSIHPQGC